MLLIPVLDLRGGMAVHARAGDREGYRPVESVLTPGVAGDAMALARAYRSMGAEWCYVADLDAIDHGAPQRDLLRALTHPAEGFGPCLLVDGGIASVARASEIRALGARGLVVGLETLGSFRALAAIVAVAGSAEVVFSLDLRRGRPLVRMDPGEKISDRTPIREIARRATEAGARTLLLLDLSNVGSATGPGNLELLGSLKVALGVRVYLGGGIRSREDLRRIEEAGGDGALVGTALHAGGLSAEGLMPGTRHPGATPHPAGTRPPVRSSPPPPTRSR